MAPFLLIVFLTLLASFSSEHTFSDRNYGVWDGNNRVLHVRALDDVDEAVTSEAVVYVSDVDQRHDHLWLEVS